MQGISVSKNSIAKNWIAWEIIPFLGDSDENVRERYPWSGKIISTNLADIDCDALRQKVRIKRFQPLSRPMSLCLWPPNDVCVGISNHFGRIITEFVSMNIKSKIYYLELIRYLVGVPFDSLSNIVRNLQ